ncbi:hypothetical protein Dda_8218 [Drechslerella dactyloides]|uniref:Sas10 C-terminal domain-containing protein n=1 Tax=Drechslerella dactyloides TaxID=74499 RepID=A0AAD6IST6_DREDA|nr:hypothetical protein Dda_8218 [Drechslerella dactyloides]
MARKSKRPRPAPGSSAGPREVDPNDAKVGRLTTYEDVADSEDEFYLNQDRVDFNEDPAAKRRRLNRDPAFDESDEEILDLEDLPSSDDSSEDDDESHHGHGSNSLPNRLQLSDDEDDDGSEDESQDEYADWGKSRKNYYDGNDIDNDEDAAMEEAEARRIQQRQLRSMTAKDFGIDEDDWKTSTDAAGDAARETEKPETYESVTVKKITIPASSADQEELLRLLHPEFEPLRQEFLRLSPLHPEIMERAKENTNPESVIRRKWIVLSSYLAVLSMYFAFMSQPRPEGQAVDLKDHPIMEALLKYRTEWLEVEGLSEQATPPPETELDKELEDMSIDDEEEEEWVEEDDDGDEEEEEEETVPPPPKAVSNSSKATKSAVAVNGNSKKSKATSTTTKEAKRLAKSDARLKDLDDLLPSAATRSKPSKAKAVVQFRDDDFGEEDFIYEEDAEDKAKRKKSLRFYTAQIHQKSNKRDRAGRDAGGDLDIPHRERNKERQERLNAEAQKRGMTDGAGAMLDDNDLSDGDYDDNDFTSAKALKGQIEADDMGDALEYYNKVASKTKLEKLKKQLEQEAARTNDRVVETETIDPETGKRAIGYTILKNKGLTPHRKKDVRNPRVKKRKKFEAAKKKLASRQAVYKPPTSAYSGEATGIRTKVIKSVKFS